MNKITNTFSFTFSILDWMRFYSIIYCLLLTSFCSFAQSIAGGFDYSLGRCTDYSVMSWGYNANNNGNGQLGDNTTTQSNSPIPVHGSGDVGFISNITNIASGSHHCLVIKNDATVWAWGENTKGTLGDNTQTDRNYPGQVSGLTNAIEVACGNDHSLALKSDGTVWAWGFNNSEGQLGINNTVPGSTRLTPVQVNTITNIIHIAAGAHHSMALKSDGTVWTWGKNKTGQDGVIGDGTSGAGNDRPAPVQVLTGTSGCGTYLCNIVAIATGISHCLALKSDGTVWAWGQNNLGQLGDGTTTAHLTPVQVSGLTGIIAIAAGTEGIHSLALKNDGTVWAWGYNNEGELGDNQVSGLQSTVPVQVHGPGNVGFLSGIVAIAAGGFHSIAIKNDGKVWTWGMGTSGQLGNTATSDSYYPVQAGSGGGNSLCNVTILPVELLSFSGTNEGQKNILHWSTASEINNDYFEIQRKNGIMEDWNTIGTVKGAGNSSSIRSYEFVDTELPSQYSIPNAQIYYRLKQTDYNGHYEYFGPISITLYPPDEWKLILENTPVNNELNGTLFLPEDSNVMLEIYDMQGRIMKREVIKAVKGTNFLHIDITNVESGIYILKIFREEKQVTGKFVKTSAK